MAPASMRLAWLAAPDHAVDDENPYTLMGSSEYRPRRRALSAEHVKRSVDAVASRLGDACASLPHCPSIKPLKEIVRRKTPRLTLEPRRLVASGADTTRSTLQRLGQIVSKIAEATSSRVSTRTAPDNQEASSRDDALAAALAWIERLEEAQGEYEPPDLCNGDISTAWPNQTR